MTDIWRVLVTGSRAWDDEPALCMALAAAVQEGPSGPLALRGEGVVIVHGACPRGADRIADTWARNHGIPVERHPADWTYGKQAGFIRNAGMVAAGADVCLAFVKPCDQPGCPERGQHGSHGATHCAGLAAKAHIPVRRFTA